MSSYKRSATFSVLQPGLRSTSDDIQITLGCNDSQPSHCLRLKNFRTETALIDRYSTATAATLREFTLSFMCLRDAFEA